MDNKYGYCERCNTPLLPVYFTQEETKLISNIWCKTGRKRTAVDYLVCDICLEKYCVDDTFDGKWY